MRRREEKERLERARGRVSELERRLETRPEVEQSAGGGTRGRQRRRRLRQTEVRREISALGFDEAAYEAAGERVDGGRGAAEKLRDAREGLGGEWKDADYRIESARTELKRLDDDRKLANEKAAAASRMDEMDGLFTEFFRSLTARARPMLEVEASDLVRELTDGRYERMEFDDNYRVKLLDRFDDSYAIERFSGGESDVASLSARVALSRIVASRGGNTLGFLVLDEVFGSLDAGRRNNVLLALERLKRSFGQIFIISHVAEVQESALVDEVWMLEEDEEGKSTVRRVNTPMMPAPERHRRRWCVTLRTFEADFRSQIIHQRLGGSPVEVLDPKDRSARSGGDLGKEGSEPHTPLEGTAYHPTRLQVTSRCDGRLAAQAPVANDQPVPFERPTGVPVT